MKCHWCLKTDHVLRDCPIRPLSHSEQREALAERMMRFRLYAGQLSRLLREHQITIPPDVAALNPDPQ